MVATRRKTFRKSLVALRVGRSFNHAAVQRLQTDPRCSAIPVVVLSADAISGQRDRLLSAGASEYLTKPLNVKKFLQVLDQTLSGVVLLEANSNSNLSSERNEG